MVKISILYPNAPGAWFDFVYYTGQHLTRAIAVLSEHPGFRAVSIERGVCVAEPEEPPRYIAACFFTFDGMESLVAAFMPHAVELQADMSNYTDITPQIQFNEILTWVPTTI